MAIVLRALHTLIPFMLAGILWVMLLHWSWLNRSGWRLTPALVLLLVGYALAQLWWVLR